MLVCIYFKKRSIDYNTFNEIIKIRILWHDPLSRWSKNWQIFLQFAKHLLVKFYCFISRSCCLHRFRKCLSRKLPSRWIVRNCWFLVFLPFRIKNIKWQGMPSGTLYSFRFVVTNINLRNEINRDNISYCNLPRSKWN